MKVLFIQVDVTNLSEEAIAELEMAMCVQTEDYDCDVLATKTAEVNEETGEVLSDEDPEDPSDPTMH